MAHYWNPAAQQWRCDATPDVRSFHSALDGYAPTRLVELPEVARELGVGRVFVKEESSRLGLPAFKILGASYAIARAVSARLGFHDAPLPLEQLRRRLQSVDPIMIMTATDGNHGLAVAHTAALLGLPSRIWFPSSITADAKRAIADAGAEPVELDLAHSDLVSLAATAARELGDAALLVQDTAWPGYEEVPGWIVDGYSTLFREASAQLAEAGVAQPDLVAVPTGVGSLTLAAVRHFRTRDLATVPIMLSVEPNAAPVVIQSLQQGEPVEIDTRHTIMTGLNCGTVSSQAWPVLRDGMDAAVTVDDEAAASAVHDLGRLGVDAGPSGAASLAGVRAWLGSAPADSGIGADSVILLLSTEGQAANPLSA